MKPFIQNTFGQIIFFLEEISPRRMDMKSRLTNVFMWHHLKVDINLFMVCFLSTQKCSFMRNEKRNKSWMIQEVLLTSRSHLHHQQMCACHRSSFSHWAVVFFSEHCECRARSTLRAYLWSQRWKDFTSIFGQQSWNGNAICNVALRPRLERPHSLCNDFCNRSIIFFPLFL